MLQNDTVTINQANFLDLLVSTRQSVLKFLHFIDSYAYFSQDIIQFRLMAALPNENRSAAFDDDSLSLYVEFLLWYCK